MESISNQTEVSLDQWRAIVAAADEGGLHAAGRRIGRSHSAVAQAVDKAEAALGVSLFVKVGRRLSPTEVGAVLIHRARHLLEQALALEGAAERLSRGVEAEIALVVDGIVPQSWLLPRLVRFSGEVLDTRLKIRHELMGGAAAAIEDRSADVVLSGTLPPGITPDPVLEVPFALVAAPALAAKLRGPGDVEGALQLVVADTARAEERRGWLRPERRWTCPSFEVALSLTRAGVGLCAAPLPWIEADLAEGRLLRLDPSRPLTVQIHAVAPLGIATGPSARALLQCLRA